MNLLPQVFVILFILSMVAYTQMEHFKLTKATSIEYTELGQKEYDRSEHEVHESLYSTSSRKTDSKKETSPRVKATRAFNLMPLLKTELDSKNPEMQKVSARLFNNLVLSYYEESPYLQKVLEDDPQIIQRLIIALPNAAERSPRFKKNQNSKQLVTLDFEDPELRKLWYEIFVGAPLTAEDPSSPEEETEAVHSLKPRRFAELIEVKKELFPIRLFLAPKELLFAIYGDDEIVTSIIEKRKELHSQVSKDSSQKNDLSQQFENSLDSLRPDWLPKERVNYQVTTSAPPKEGSSSKFGNRDSTKK